MQEKIYLYPIWVRLWHLVNALLCLLLIITGLSMQYSGVDAYIIRFDIAVSIHNIAGIILSVNYVFFIIGNLTTSNGRQYIMKRNKIFNNLFRQFRFYSIGIFKKENAPFPITKASKFNPLQRFSYIVVTYICLTMIVLTGWFYFFPGIIPNTILGVSGIMINALLHVTFGFAISFFLIIHIYFCTIGASPLSNFKSIITGWHSSHH